MRANSPLLSGLPMTCPTHNKRLKRKPILWGMPEPGPGLDKYILGGCCIMPDAPEYGYVCTVDDAVFIKNENGELIKWNED